MLIEYTGPFAFHDDHVVPTSPDSIAFFTQIATRFRNFRIDEVSIGFKFQDGRYVGRFSIHKRDVYTLMQLHLQGYFNLWLQHDKDISKTPTAW